MSEYNFVPEMNPESDLLDEVEGILTSVRVITRKNSAGTTFAQMVVTLDNGQRAIAAVNRATAEAMGLAGGRAYTFPLAIGEPFALRIAFVPVFNAKTGNTYDAKHYLMPDTRKGDSVDLAHTPTLEEYLASDYPGKPPVEGAYVAADEEIVL